MSEIMTGSRVHFGLFQPGPVPPGERRFGSAGMMIASLGFHIRMTPASSWSAEGSLAERALGFARKCLERVEVPPHHLTILQAPPEHVGLGSGTQLGLAIARLLAPGLSALELAELSGRGRRSGLGVHGFDRGGFLVDGGRYEGGPPAGLAARMDVPSQWRILLVMPPGDANWHGKREQSAFDALAPSPHTDRLCRLTLLGMLPALAERDCDRFGEALHEFNALSGEVFAPAQGGNYAGPAIAEAVAHLRSLGVRGTGQSSWGPLVFGIVADADRAVFVARRMSSVAIAEPLNRGAVLL